MITSPRAPLQRICHITSAHPADDIRIFHKECVTLAYHGYDVHLVAVGSRLVDPKGVNHHVIAVNNRFGRLGRMLFRSRRAYRLARATKASLFHFHDPELLPYGLLLKWQGYVVIYDAHEDLPRDVMTKDWIPRYLRKVVSVLIEKIENSIARRMDKVICATPHISKRFQAIGANAIDVKNYPNLSECAPIFSDLTDFKAVPAICYVGIISLQRGIVEMIQAAYHSKVRLIIAGKFIDKKTENLVRLLPGWNNVDYRGVVPRSGIQVFRIFS